MLYDFLKSNRPELITRCRAKVAKRSGPPPSHSELNHGIPLFLDQLTEMLPGGSNSGTDPKPTPGKARSPAEIRIEDGAKTHGAELLRHDFTIEQVVHDYGDLCQAITELAVEQSALIEPHEFGILNIRLDNAIASAVTSYARKATVHDEVSMATADDLRQIAHEMRNLHTTITIAIAALNRGTVGFGGATAAALDKSMARMGKLLDRVVALAH